MKYYSLFADILDYPTPFLARQLDELCPLVATEHSGAGQLLDRFRDFVLKTAQRELEEFYSSTFDLQPLCCPYVGYQLFGEEFRRGLFMAQLREHYRLCGFIEGRDLPDHVCVILRFLTDREFGEVEQELMADCLVPALKKMEADFGGVTNHYRDVIHALVLALGGEIDGTGAVKQE